MILSEKMAVCLVLALPLALLYCGLMLKVFNLI